MEGWDDMEDKKQIAALYQKLRGGKTLTGEECAALEAWEQGVAERAAARAACKPKSWWHLEVARACWADGAKVVP